MGYYINETSKGEDLPSRRKAAKLIEDGAVLANPIKYQPDLVCVIENGAFDAAAYIFSEKEFNEFYNDNTGRNTTWLVYEHAAELSGYSK